MRKLPALVKFVPFEYYRQKRDAATGKIADVKVGERWKGFGKAHGVIGGRLKLWGSEKARRTVIQRELSAIASSPTRLREALKVMFENHGLVKDVKQAVDKIMDDPAKRNTAAQALQHNAVVETILKHSTRSPVKAYHLDDPTRQYPQTTGGILASRIEVADVFRNRIKKLL